MRSIICSLAAAAALFSFELVAAVPDFVEGQLLLKPKDGVSEASLKSILAAHGAEEIGAISQINVRKIRVPQQALDKVLDTLQHNPNIEFAEKDAIAQGFLVPNDPLYSGNEWHLPKIGAPSAWDLTTGANGVVVAVVDTGIEFSHPDLQGRILAGYDFVSNDSDPSDDNGHGTESAGTASASGNNSTGVAGVSWASLILPVKVLNSSGSGSYSAIANGVTYAADHGARIINMSLGGSSSSLTLQNAVDYAWKKNIVLIAAAGNDGTSNPSYPAACKNVVGVSATNSSDALTSWSNYGSYVALSAPGENIATTGLGGQYFSVSGTSFSSPIIAGVAALMASINPQLSNQQIVDALKSSADDLGAAGYDVYYGYGRVNAASAVAAAKSIVTADTILPIVSITSPAAGATLSGSVNVSVSASDNVGVTKVELYINGALAAQSANAPATFAWNTTAGADGSYTLEARAYDAAGNVGISTVLTVGVKNTAAPADVTAPAVAITSPTDGATVSKTVSVSITSSDDRGVTKVELYVDGARAGTSTSANAVFSWNTTKAGNGLHKLQAKAYDAAGNIGASAIVSVSVRK